MIIISKSKQRFDEKKDNNLNTGTLTIFYSLL